MCCVSSYRTLAQVNDTDPDNVRDTTMIGPALDQDTIVVTPHTEVRGDKTTR
jgi:hypothetical protein